MRVPTCLTGLIAVLTAIRLAAAAEIIVDGAGSGDYSTIQAGISAASDGDTILVYPGTYYETIDFAGKDITLMGDETNPELVIIDGGGSGPVITFDTATATASMISGFTIQAGSADMGAGIYGEGSGLTISNNIITDNAAVTDGGGIYCDLTDSTVSGNVITGNEAGDQGGGLYSESATLSISDNRIINNRANWGGGIYSKQGGDSIIDNLITNNFVAYAGGGICYNYYLPIIANNRISSNRALYGGGIIGFNCADTLITNNEITNNRASDFGGGICCYCGDALILNNRIMGNTAEGHYGGGIDCDSSDAIIVGNVIAQNSARRQGGGISCVNVSDPTVINNTIAYNSAASGGGISCSMWSNPIFANDIIWGNSATVSGDQVRLEDDNCDPYFDYCDVEGGYAAFALGVGVTYNYGSCWGTGNINSNPNFSGRRTHPYALLSTSPCIDTGDTSELAHMTSISVFTHEIIWSFTYSPYDAGNSDRLADGDSDGTEAVDMGAYEFMR